MLKIINHFFYQITDINSKDISSSVGSDVRNLIQLYYLDPPRIPTTLVGVALVDLRSLRGYGSPIKISYTYNITFRKRKKRLFCKKEPYNIF